MLPSWRHWLFNLFRRGNSPKSNGHRNVRPALEFLEDQTLPSVWPFVQSINRTTPSAAITNASSVAYTVTFSEAVTGVDPTDFQSVTTGTVATTLVQVTPVNAAVYTVTLSGITGNGTLGLNLVDNGSIRDLAGDPLTSTNAPLILQAQQTFATGQKPDAMAVGDVNGDGKPDLVVANFASPYHPSTVSVLLGNGNGTFQNQQTFATGYAPMAVAIGDINGDGKPDLMVTNTDNNGTVGVLLGNGNGTFQAQQNFPTGISPRSVAVADVNGDGKPDLVVANNGIHYSPEHTVSVLLGNGNGTFQPQRTFATGYYPISVAVADVNGDGKPDLVIANFTTDASSDQSNGSVSVLLGNGNGTFQPQLTLATNSGPISVAVADVNGDGKPDIAVANYRSSTVSLLLGNGNGSFQAQQTVASGPHPMSVAATDLNGDGLSDLAVANRANGSVGVLLGNGNGTFQPQQTFATGAGPVVAAISDVNGDSKPDLVVANNGSNTVSALLNGATGSFTVPVYTIDTVAPFVQSINRTSPAGPVTAASTVTYTVTFSEPVTGVDLTDFQLAQSGTVAATVSQVAQVSGAVYTLTVGGITGIGSLGLNLVNNGSVHDLAGNGLGQANFVGQTYTIVPHFALGVPSNTTAGNAFGVSVTVLDPSNNAVTGYTGTIHFITSDTGASAFVPADYTFVAGDNGRHTFANGVELVSAGNQTVTAIDTAVTSTSGTSNAIVVNPAPASHIALNSPGSATAGTAFNFTVIALDPFNNTATGYVGILHFTNSSSAATLPADTTLTNGTGTFSSTLRTAGNSILTAADTVTGSIAGSSNTITVIAGPATHFAVTPPTSATAGVAISLSVMALDLFNNIVTDYKGTIHFSSSDGQAGLPANSTLSNGIGSFAVTLKTAGNETVTAADTASSALSGTTPISVSAAATAHFVLNTSSGLTAGSLFVFTIKALDQFNNPTPAYAGTVHFSSTDSQAVLPGDTTLTSGSGTFGADLKTAGIQTLTASDTVTNIVTGNLTVTVSAAAATDFALSVPSTTLAGNPLVFSVSAQDSFGNTATSYSGTVHFSSSDIQAGLPANAKLTSGIGQFAAILMTPGIQTLTAADSTSSSVSGTSAGILVGTAAANHFDVAAPSFVTLGKSFNFTVTVQNNVFGTATGYTGTVHFQSSDPSATLPLDATLTNGTGTFSAVLNAAGNQTITVYDAAAKSITGRSGPIAVSTSATHFAVSAVSNTAAGSPFAFSVTALDSLNNPATGYTGIIRLTTNDAQASLVSTATLTGGSGVFAVVLKTAGIQTITATDIVTSTITGTSGPITVTGLAATDFVITVPKTAVTGMSFAVTVNAQDSFGNTAAGYSSTVHFTSSDLIAGLPANATLIGGQGIFSATLKSPGTQTITVTDAANSGITGVSHGMATVGLTVTSLTPTSTGFVATFDKPFDPSVINLYDSEGIFGSDDVILTGPGAPQTSFHGSLIIDPTATTITFVKTSTFTNAINSFDPNTGILTPGTYTVTFRSAANGFKDLLGGLLDRNADGVPGDNFSTTFVVSSAPSVVVGIPGFARGPDSARPVNLPNTQTAGIPINLSNGTGVTAGKFILQYNSALLSVTGASVNAAFAGATLALDATSTPGNAVIDFTSPTPLSAGMIRLGGLVATVPNSAASSYKAKALLHFSSVQLNGGAVPVAADDAVQVVAYFGDASGDAALSGGDAALISRVATGVDDNPALATVSGFSAYPLADPALIADLNAGGTVDASDVTLINSFLTGTPRPQIPPIPAGLTIAPTGPDPSLSLPLDLEASAGETVIVPVNIDTARPAGSTGMTEAILALRFDPTIFSVSAADIALGTLVAGTGLGVEEHIWQLTAVVNNQTGEIGIDLFSTTPIQTTAPGSLVSISMHARTTAPAGSTALSLMAQADPTGLRVYQTSVSDAQGALVLHTLATTAGMEFSQPCQISSTGAAVASQFVVPVMVSAISTQASDSLAMTNSLKSLVPANPFPIYRAQIAASMEELMGWEVGYSEPDLPALGSNPADPAFQSAIRNLQSAIPVAIQSAICNLQSVIPDAPAESALAEFGDAFDN